MELLHFLFCIQLLAPMFRAFLLNDKTTLPCNGISDHHYLAVMELLAEEIKARKHLEVAMTQLYNDVVMKTSNISGSHEQTKKRTNYSIWTIKPKCWNKIL